MVAKLPPGLRIQMVNNRLTRASLTSERLRHNVYAPEIGRFRPIRPARTTAVAVLVAALAALALGVAAQPAAAKTPCWKQVIDDWHDHNGRITGDLPAPLLPRGDRARSRGPAGLHRDRRGHPERPAAGEPRQRGVRRRSTRAPTSDGSDRSRGPAPRPRPPRSRRRAEPHRPSSSKPSTSSARGTPTPFRCRS